MQSDNFSEVDSLITLRLKEFHNALVGRGRVSLAPLPGEAVEELIDQQIARRCSQDAAMRCVGTRFPHAGLCGVPHQSGTRQATLRSTGIDGTRPGADLSDIPA
jgi:hypothetical protein